MLYVLIFHSSLTHRKYVIKCDDKNINTLNCSTSNCIYLITCCRCGLQYVGETVQSLRDRFSGHRAGMKNPFADNRCKILSKHFSVGLCKNANYIVNIIEKLSGSGRDDNGNPIPGVTVERQKKETKWMLTLQTVYPYGLNDRVGDEYMAEKIVELLAISSYHCIVYTNVQSIITERINLIILS